MTRSGLFLLALGLAGSTVRPSLAVEPMRSAHDLVAGQGQAGYRDGEFTRARFRSPTGLSLSPDRSSLFVADRDNHRIRLVRLENKNSVETLAGSGRRDRNDGTFQEASFDRPTGLVSVSDGLLIVNDEGNALLRSLDLKTRQVTTLAGNGGHGTQEGPARKVALGGVWSIVFVAAENALYFSQPDLGALRRLDLKSNFVTTVLQNDSRLPNPAALALFQGRLCVADRSGVISVVRTGPRKGKGRPAVLENVGRGDRIVAMAESGPWLYALQAGGDSRLLCVSTGKSLPVLSVSGDVMDAPGSGDSFLPLDGANPAGFVADPRVERSFLLSTLSLQAVLWVRDLDFFSLRDTGAQNPSGLHDFDYPRPKPAGTFRVLLVGDSHLYYGSETEIKKMGIGFSRVHSVPKRLELMLNTLAALDQGTVRYEVLTLARVSWEPLAIWPSFDVPKIVEDFNIDLVVLMMPPGTSTLAAYLERPITEEGIPASRIDPEYLLEPFKDRARKSPALALLERSTALGWAHTDDPTQVYLEPLETLLTDAVARQEILELFAKPLRSLDRKLKEVGAARGKPVSFEICFFAYGTRGLGGEEEDLWRDLTARERIGFLDLAEPMFALRDTYYPLTEEYGFDHFTVHGHAFVAFLLAHELVRRELVPFRRH